MVAVRWYPRYGLSYRDVEELLAERGVEVDHVTVYRWVQRFTPLLIDAARFARHPPGDRWFVDETYVEVTGSGAMSIEQSTTLRTLKVVPSEVVTDAAPLYPVVLEGVLPSAWHHVEQYANNPVEADHVQLKRRVRPMRGHQTDRTAQIVIAGHAVLHDLSRGHDELGVDARPQLRVAGAFTEPAHSI